MTEDKWLDLKAKIEDKFDILDQHKEELEDTPGTIEYIVFISPLGKVKLERTIKPVVLDKKTTYTRRIGGQTAVDYVYSETETVDKIKALKWNDDQDDWEEMEAEGFLE
ncbi:MAG TPA: hypothetical protein VGA49_03325 [Patescibacteria group bacterium]